MRLSSITVTLLGILLCLAGPLRAEQFQAFDQYEVHYNAFNSSFLSPDVAKAYDIQRSKYKGLVNIAVLDRSADQDRPVAALVNGSIKNLLDQSQSLVFTEIREGSAVYYITDFRFSDDEQMRFSISVQPDPNKPAYELNFKHHFYVD